MWRVRFGRCGRARVRRTIEFVQLFYLFLFFFFARRWRGVCDFYLGEYEMCWGLLRGTEQRALRNRANEHLLCNL